MGSPFPWTVLRVVRCGPVPGAVAITRYRITGQLCWMGSIQVGTQSMRKLNGFACLGPNRVARPYYRGSGAHCVDCCCGVGANEAERSVRPPSLRHRRKGKCRVWRKKYRALNCYWPWSRRNSVRNCCLYCVDGARGVASLCTLESLNEALSDNRNSQFHFPVHASPAI